MDFFRSSPQGALAVLDLNTYNLLFITVGLLLHWRPKRFMRAVAECIPATGGVLIQFPFYAVIFGMIVGTGMTDWLASLFARISTQQTYPLLVAFYSACWASSFPRAAASGSSKRLTFCRPPTFTTFTWDGWCRSTTPPRPCPT